MTSEHQQKIRAAENIVRDYGDLLSSLDLVSYGFPRSRLPHSKDHIKDAIQLLLQEINHDDETLRNSLIEAYVFLAQFIADDEAEIVACGQAALVSNDFNHSGWKDADQTLKIINAIKLEMETLLGDLQVFLS